MFARLHGNQIRELPDKVDRAILKAKLISLVAVDSRLDPDSEYNRGGRKRRGAKLFH